MVSHDETSVKGLPKKNLDRMSITQSTQEQKHLIASLTFIFDGPDKILLGLKKRGFGSGKFNGYGGFASTYDGFQLLPVPF